MDDLRSIPFGTSAPRLPLAKPRKCGRHARDFRTPVFDAQTNQQTGYLCGRCKAFVASDATRRSKNNRKRGGSWEREAAADIGGRRMGQLNLPWDVECAGYLRLQTKQLARWPSFNSVVEWLDAMGAGEELRGVALKGRGQKARRLVIFDWDNYIHWHGRK